jgi:predicted metal-binding membrane protein
MRILRVFSEPPLPWLFALAGVATAASAILPKVLQIPELCGAPVARFAVADLPLALGPEWSVTWLVAGWLVMVVAMMAPLLGQPLGHVWRSSLPGRRPWALLLFAIGYLLAWSAAGVVLVPAAAMLKLSLPEGAAAAVGQSIALLWSASPGCQRARNRCHRTYSLAACGRRADRDCLVYGTRWGLPCAAACWPWMLATMCVDQAHAAAMVIVAIVLFLERMAPPSVPVWQLPPAVQALRALLPPQKVLGSTHPPKAAADVG